MPVDVRPLVGRAEPLEAIEAALAAARRPPLIALVGEPGIGKTRLLAELAARAGGRGCLVLGGRASEFEDDLPFGAFIDALDDHVRGLGPRRLAGLEPDELAELAAIFPAIEAPAGVVATALGGERFRAHRALRALLEGLAAGRPLVVALDDVHWADQASAEALAHLLRNPPNARVLVAVAYRPAQLGRRLRAALAAGEQDGRVRTIALGPLAAREADELLGAGIARERRETIYAESGGNPFYLEQLARVAADRGRAGIAGGAHEGGVPRAVVAAIERELAALPADSRALLQGAAVAGDPFELDLALAAAALDEQAALPALDRLIETGLARATSAPRRFTLRHPLVRRAVYESAGPGWRLGAHERLVALQRARDAPAAELAHHVEASARPGDERAVALLARAGQAHSAHAPALAARRYAAALRLLPQGHQHAGRRLELLLPLAASLVASGGLSEGRGALLEALELLPAEAAGERVRVEASCAAVEHLIGLHAYAHSRLVSAFEALPERRSAEGACPAGRRRTSSCQRCRGVSPVPAAEAGCRVRRRPDRQNVGLCERAARSPCARPSQATGTCSPRTYGPRSRAYRPRRRAPAAPRPDCGSRRRRRGSAPEVAAVRRAGTGRGDLARRGPGAARRHLSHSLASARVEPGVQRWR